MELVLEPLNAYIYQAKKWFLAYLSREVHHPNGKQNTLKMQIPLLGDFELDITDSCDKNPELYLYELEEEIAFLANLMNKGYTHTPNWHFESPHDIITTSTREGTS